MSAKLDAKIPCRLPSGQAALSVIARRGRQACVVCGTGAGIGTIQRLVIDKLTGRAVYAVAQFGGFLGVGGKEYSIPWATLTYDTRLGGYRTDVTGEQLKNAPTFGNGAERDYGRTGERELNVVTTVSPNYWDGVGGVAGEKYLDRLYRE